MKRGETQPGKATIFDVAEQAGVSIKTVSRVVNDEPNVREGTRAKVLDVVSRLRYRPNAAARSLSRQRSRVLGLIYASPDEFSYMKDVLDGALGACDERDYSLMLRPLTLPNPELLDQVERFVTQARVEGVILPAPIGDLPDLVRVLERMQVRIATITPRVPVEGQVNVLCEDEAASFSLTEFLIQRGHRAIGFIKGDPEHGATDQRFAGYRRALDEHGIRYAERFVRQGYFDFDSGKTAAAELLALPEAPTAIIGSNDDMAAGVLLEARQRDLAIPADLSVAGFDDTPLASRLWPPLTTIRQPIREMARTAALRLMERLSGKPMEPPASFGCELVIRESTSGSKTIALDNAVIS